MTDPVAATGPRLKAERERRGLSSQKAADELHLDGWIIEALEAEDYPRIGPSVYAKGHLKRYAALLGLPAAEIMAGYESRTQAPKPTAALPAAVRLRTDGPAAIHLPWPRLAGAAALGLLAIGAWWWKPWRGHSARPAAVEAVAVDRSAAADSAALPDGPAAAALPTAPAASLPTAPAVVPAMLPASTPPPPSASASAEPDTAGAGRARLRLSFSADSWVDVRDAAGRQAFAGNGRANSVKTIAGLAPMRVYLGFASGVQLEINNRAVAIGPQFVAGDVARFEAGADGVLRRDSHSAPAPGVTAPGAQTRNARPTG